MNVTATGAVSGTNFIGIDAYQDASGGSMTIAAGDITSNYSAIYVRNYGSGALTVTVNGTVNGANVAGIQARTFAANQSNITLNTGASVSGGTGSAILNNDGNSTTTVNAGASVTGSFNLNGGTDEVIFDGGDFSGVTTINGGSGTDNVTFRNVTGNVSGGTMVNIEGVIVDTGSDISINGTVEANVAVNGGGQLSAGSSPGLLSIVGNLDLGVGSTTLVELGGLLGGTNYDQIDVSDDLGTGPIEGIATLAAGAIIDVDFFGGFVAGIGDKFDIIIADDIVGDVGTLIFDFSDAALAFGLDWTASIVSLEGGRESLQIVAISEPAPLATFLTGLLGLFGIGRKKGLIKA